MFLGLTDQAASMGRIPWRRQAGDRHRHQPDGLRNLVDLQISGWDR